MVKERIKKIKEINEKANAGIKQNIKNAKEDPRLLALVVLEMLLITLIVLALLFILDPNISFPEAENIPWPVKLLLFVATVILVIWVYNYTSEFRKSR